MLPQMQRHLFTNFFLLNAAITLQQVLLMPIKIIKLKYGLCHAYTQPICYAACWGLSSLKKDTLQSGSKFPLFFLFDYQPESFERGANALNNP